MTGQDNQLPMAPKLTDPTCFSSDARQRVGAIPQFCFVHEIYQTATMVGADRMPDWLRHKDNAWFLNQHVLTLQVGQSTRSEFHIITRTR